MEKEKGKLTFRGILFAGIKKFAGDIIGIVLLACCLWAFPSVKSLWNWVHEQVRQIIQLVTTRPLSDADFFETM